jgi:hypothetical protein
VALAVRMFMEMVAKEIKALVPYFLLLHLLVVVVLVGLTKLKLAVMVVLAAVVV